MKFAFVKFYDLCYTSAWEETKLEIEDTIHTGIGVLLEDADTHITIAMALGNNENQPLSKLLIPKPMIINYVIIDENCFSDRLFINGYGSFTENGEIKENEKTSNRDYKSIKLQQGEDDNPEFVNQRNPVPHPR